MRLKTVGTALMVAMAGVPGGRAWAQGTAPAPAVPGAADEGWGPAGAIVVLAVLVLLVGAAVKLFDLRRKRTAEAVHLQSLLSDALLRDERLHGTTVTPTARVTFWSGSPATVELTGQVTDEAQRQAALESVRAESARLRSDVVIEDRVVVTPAVARVAA